MSTIWPNPGATAMFELLKLPYLCRCCYRAVNFVYKSGLCERCEPSPPR